MLLFLDIDILPTKIRIIFQIRKLLLIYFPLKFIKAESSVGVI